MDTNFQNETFHLEFTIKKLKKKLEDKQKELNDVTLQLIQALSETETLTGSELFFLRYTKHNA